MRVYRVVTAIEASEFETVLNRELSCPACRASDESAYLVDWRVIPDGAEGQYWYVAVIEHRHDDQ